MRDRNAQHHIVFWEDAKTDADGEIQAPGPGNAGSQLAGSVSRKPSSSAFVCAALSIWGKCPVLEMISIRTDRYAVADHFQIWRSLSLRH